MSLPYKDPGTLEADPESPEVQADNPGEPDSLSATTQHFDPGPSFVNDGPPAVRLTELPAWLQTFAATVGDPADDVATESSDEIEPSLHLLPVAEPEFPENPLDGEGQDSEVPSTPVDASDQVFEIPESEDDLASVAETSTTSMITEEDLPEWLRAIDYESSDTQNDQVNISELSSESQQDLPIPSTSPAWISSDRHPTMSESGSVFALVASLSRESESEFANHMSQPDSDLIDHSQPPAEDSTTPDNAESQEGSSAMRRVLIPAVLVGILLIVVVVLLLQFVV